MSSENTKIARFRFLSYLIPSVSLNLTGKEVGEDMEFGICPEGELNENDCQFILTLDVTVKDKDDNLNLKLTIKGVYEYETNVVEELIPYISMNAPAILFPYIRAYISNITSLGGMQPIILPTLNVEGVGEELISKMQLQR